MMHHRFVTLDSEAFVAVVSKHFTIAAAHRSMSPCSWSNATADGVQAGCDSGVSITAKEVQAGHRMSSKHSNKMLMPTIVIAVMPMP